MCENFQRPIRVFVRLRQKAHRESHDFPIYMASSALELGPEDGRINTGMLAGIFQNVVQHYTFE